MSDMFVRILKKKQMRQMLAMLKKEFNAEPEKGDTLNRVYAPDGDLVFSALEYRSNTYIVRLHKEVFSQGYEDEKAVG